MARCNLKGVDLTMVRGELRDPNGIMLERGWAIFSCPERHSGCCSKMNNAECPGVYGLVLCDSGANLTEFVKGVR